MTRYAIGASAPVDVTAIFGRKPQAKQASLRLSLFYGGALTVGGLIWRHLGDRTDQRGLAGHDPLLELILIALGAVGMPLTPRMSRRPWTAASRPAAVAVRSYAAHPPNRAGDNLGFACAELRPARRKCRASDSVLVLMRCLASALIAFNPGRGAQSPA